jgi:uncharacterized phage protein gp47/JayE
MVDDIVDSLEDSERAAFGNGVNTLATSVLGQVNGVFAGSLAENWEVLNEVYQSFNPNAATGAALDRLAALTGVVRLPATKSALTAAGGNPVVCTGTAGTILLTGRVVSITLSGDRFVSTADATLVALVAWAPTTAYVIGDRRENGGNAYVVTVAGTSAGAGGPGGTTPGLDIIDDGVTWRFIGVGVAAADVDYEAEEFGSVPGLADLMTIESPIAGWDDAQNLLDATVGRDLETDADLRIRRNDLLRAAGSATVEAIRADLIDTDGVTEAIVFENDTIITDGEGRPAKSIECVVRGGTDVDVAFTIFNSKAAGIATFGFPGVIVTEIVTDSQGIDHTINFSRPVDIEIFVDIEVDINAATYEGDAALEAAIKLEGDGSVLGDDVIAERIKCAAFDVAGVVDVTSFIIDVVTIPPGVNTANIPIALRALSVFDTGRIDVISTPI